uniref:Uncharacterized protein n=1 Tax=Physcomitrium patens TaxID=3218 RepID=A0A2K1KZJ2_PHYPA|nr:hypothetical protein PHYPA_001980 [Physcomitrium patens]
MNIDAAMTVPLYIVTAATAQPMPDVHLKSQSLTSKCTSYCDVLCCAIHLNPLLLTTANATGYTQYAITPSIAANTTGYAQYAITPSL